MKNYKKLQDVIWEITTEAYKTWSNSDYTIAVEKYPNDEDKNIYAIFIGGIDAQNLAKENITIEEVNRFFVAEAIENLSNLYPVKLKHGIMYQQTQNAYLDYNSKLNRDVYTSKAIDEDGNNYSLIWEITDKESEDESNACDWSEFEVIEEI